MRLPSHSYQTSRQDSVAVHKDSTAIWQSTTHLFARDADDDVRPRMRIHSCVCVCVYARVRHRFAASATGHYAAPGSSTSSALCEHCYVRTLSFLAHAHVYRFRCRRVFAEHIRGPQRKRLPVRQYIKSCSYTYGGIRVFASVTSGYACRTTSLRAKDETARSRPQLCGRIVRAASNYIVTSTSTVLAETHVLGDDHERAENYPSNVCQVPRS